MLKQVDSQTDYEEASISSGVSLNQSWLWGETRSNSTSVRTILAGYPVTIYVRSNNSGFMKFGYVPRAFNQNFFDNNENAEELIEYGRGLGLAHLIIEPNARYSQDLTKKLSENGLKESGKTIQPNQTQIVDLNMSEDELLSGMKSKTRQYVRKTAKSGIKVSVDNSEAGFDKFYEVMESIVARKSYVMHDRKYFQKIYNTYKDGDQLTILIAEKDDELLGAYFTIATENTMYELYGGVKPEGERLRVGYALKWSSILTAKKLGYKTYDMWGVSPRLEDGSFDDTDSMFQISRFKSSFGGETVTFMPQLTYVYSEWKYGVFSQLLKLHKVIINIKKL